MYYYNKVTKRTSWQRPQELGPESDASDSGDGDSVTSDDTDNSTMLEGGRHGWVRITPRDGKAYYFNEATNTTQWAPPADF